MIKRTNLTRPNFIISLFQIGLFTIASAKNSPECAAPTGRVALKKLWELLYEKSADDRRQFLEKLYSSAVHEYVRSLLARSDHDAGTMPRLREVISSLDLHRVHSNCDLTHHNGKLLLDQLLTLCQPLSRVFVAHSEMNLFCASLTSTDAQTECPLHWSVALPMLRAKKVNAKKQHAPDPSLSAFRALFESDEWLNAGRHLLVVPILVGSETDVKHVDARVREFCVWLEDEWLVMGSVARELLQLHAKNSAQVATQCFQLI